MAQSLVDIVISAAKQEIIASSSSSHSTEVSLSHAAENVFRIADQAPDVALLTGAADKPYAVGLALALAAAGLRVEVVGGDEVVSADLLDHPGIAFLNLRDQRPEKSAAKKLFRILAHYVKLIRYAAATRAPVFHLLWNNKFAAFDRTLLVLYYRALGKRVVHTAHNVNARKRDGNDSWWNRFTLGVQYRLSEHIFVHSPRMKQELVSEFKIAEHNVTVIPFGINNTVPNTALTRAEARQRIGLAESDKALLFFGNIAAYKGLDYLIKAFEKIAPEHPEYRLLIAGRLKAAGDDHWTRVQQAIASSKVRDRIIERIEYIPDEETEVYFKAADVLVLPYTHIFQSGVLFLGYSFGLPALASDVGSLREEIVEGETGFVFKPRDSDVLGAAVERYFASTLFAELSTRREEIRRYANERYSWSKVAAVTTDAYTAIVPDSRTVGG